MSVWLGKTFKGVDLRNYGSGATGATNTFRVLGFEIGLIILFFDVIKALILPTILFLLNIHISNQEILFLGMTCTFGHIFPFFSDFRGGKGVATLFGIMSFLYPISSLISLLLFVLILLIYKYVSLSSILSSYFLFLSVLIFYNPLGNNEYITISTIPILVTLTHRKNILRLLKNQEPKITLGK